MVRGILWQVWLLQQSRAWERQSAFMSIDIGQAENKVMLYFRFGDRCCLSEEELNFFQDCYFLVDYRKHAYMQVFVSFHYKWLHGVCRP